MDMMIGLFKCEAPDCKSSDTPGLTVVLLYDLEKSGKEARGRQDSYKEWNDSVIEELSRVSCPRCKTTNGFRLKATYPIRQSLSKHPKVLKKTLEKMLKTNTEIQRFIHAMDDLDPITFDTIEKIENLRRFYLRNKDIDVSTQLYVWYVRSWAYFKAKSIADWKSIAEGTWDTKSDNWEIDSHECNIPEAVPLFFGKKEHRRWVKVLFLEGRFLIQLWLQGGYKALLLHTGFNDVFPEMDRTGLKIIRNEPSQKTRDVYDNYIDKTYQKNELGTGFTHHYCDGFEHKKPDVLLSEDQYDLLAVRGYGASLRKNRKKEKELRQVYRIYDRETFSLYPKPFLLKTESTPIALTTVISIQQILHTLKNGAGSKEQFMNDIEDDLNQFFEDEIAQYQRDTLIPSEKLSRQIEKISLGTPMSKLPEPDQQEIKEFARKSPRFAMALRKAQFVCREQIRHSNWSKLMDMLEQEMPTEYQLVDQMQAALGKGKQSFGQIIEAISVFTEQVKENIFVVPGAAFRSAEQFSWKPDQLYRIDVSSVPRKPDMNFMHIFLYRQDKEDMVRIQVNKPIETSSTKFNLGIRLHREDEGFNVILMAYSQGEVTLDEAWFKNHVLTEPENMAMVIDRIADQGGYIVEVGSVTVTV
ncbi:hypothetical protein [Desulfobacter latus]|uniref:Uncharacterized protein n=1 Tax=Desulfobacter latus TaxID=2292 RepID=A0A850T1M0_9BACT|nr:hypothetical protein [Desulfobacter latus]NWH04991.1 hypothetical protein [Desulfobacter latus]